MIRKILFTIALALLSVTLLAEKSNLTGIVIDGKTKEPIIGATIVINNTTGTITDINGNFNLPVNPGVYNVKVSYISYDTKTIDNVKIEDGKSTALKIELMENVISLEGVTVTAVKRTNNEAFTINNIKSAPVVITGISSQLITRTQDKDASEVVKRLSGVSVVDDKFIVIRGLSSRYNNVWINNSTAPSSDPDTRSFSFDIIPSSIIENIFIVKSPMAELPSDYSGGFIKLSTIGVPSENLTSISYGTGFNQYTSFSTFYKEGQNIWDPIKGVGTPDQKISLNLNRKYEKGKFLAGNVISLNYGISNNYYNVQNNNYSIYDFVNDKPNYNDEFIDEQYKHSTKSSILYNWTIYPTDNLKIDVKNFVNNIRTSNTLIRNGREWYNDGRYIRSTELSSSNRFIYTGQLGIEKKFENDIIDFTTGYSITKKHDPDIRRYKYLSDDNITYFILHGNNPDLASHSFMDLNLNENLLTSGLNYTHNFKNLEFKSGLFFENKWRDFGARNYGYALTGQNFDMAYSTLPIEEIMTSDAFVQEEVTAPSDSYQATGQIFAGYLNGKLDINKVTVSGGLRIEKDIQTLDSYRQGTTIPVHVKRDTVNFFPSANITYNINTKNIIRSTYGLSINRPEFREIAPFYFVDFDLNAGIYGNEDIQAAYIHNFDLRYELYPKNDEMLALGVFYKKFLNPIEVVILGNNPTQYSFDNIPSAYTYGIELDVKKNITKKLLATGNVSLMKSSISFDRPLQGQSPYIVNVGLYYNEPKTKVSVVYNVIGKRIVAVGRPSPNEWESIPDIYEMPRHEIDLMATRSLGKHLEVKFGIKNILNTKTNYQQNINTSVDMSLYGSEGMKYFDRTQLVKSYQQGIGAIINLSYKF